MKILGKTKKGFIVEVTNEEAANLVSQNSGYSSVPYTDTDGKKSACEVRELPIGATVEAGKLYQQAQAIVYSFGDMKKLLGRIKGAITTFENSQKPEA